MLANSIVCYFDRFDHVFFLTFFRLTFYHHDVFLSSSDDEVHIRINNLCRRRVYHHFTSDTGNTYFRNDFLNRYSRYSQCSRCSQTSQCIRHYLVIIRNQGNQYLYFTQVAFWEQRT
ncbi:hypothetical protein D3C87_1609900 [compost metagenome]